MFIFTWIQRKINTNIISELNKQFVVSVLWCLRYLFHPLSFQAEGVLSLPVSVCPSSHPSVCKLYLVRMITHHRCEPQLPNLHHTCIMDYSQLVLKVEVINFDLQGHFGNFDSEFWEIWLVCTITHHWFGLQSPNLHQTYILGYSQLVLKIEVMDFDLQGHFAILT